MKSIKKLNKLMFWLNLCLPRDIKEPRIHNVLNLEFQEKAKVDFP